MSDLEKRPGHGPGGKDTPPVEGSPSEPALGSDPFADRSEDHALEEWLDAAERFVEGGAEARAAHPTAAGAETPARRAARTRPAIPHPRGPTLSEVELAPARGMLERFLDDDARRRVEALAEALPAEGTYDAFGLSAGAVRRAFPFLYALYRLYFRVQSEGHANIPTEGPALLVANHGGLLPFDGAMTATDVALHTDPPRLVRSIVELWAGTLPFVNVFFARVGQVIGTRENVSALLDEGELLLVFPEGIDGIRKPISQRYRLQHFHVGFIEHALRARAPIVPVAIVGSDDQAPILYDVKPLARLLGLPTVPITPTFPWLGPLGLLPYPIGYKIVYGEPLRIHERYGPEAADEVRLVRGLSVQVRRTVQQLLDRSR